MPSVEPFTSGEEQAKHLYRRHVVTHCFSFSFTDGTGILCSSITRLIKGGMMTVYVDELVQLHYHYVHVLIAIL